MKESCDVIRNICNVLRGVVSDKPEGCIKEFRDLDELPGDIETHIKDCLTCSKNIEKLGIGDLVLLDCLLGANLREDREEQLEGQLIKVFKKAE